ncbi:DEKNAAC102721 [Brettanomyces naardenensis]|uniref:DEKNAAC102721 n=1 Tax=Brettanomyces naardenensis TaxID=13370 RepID=A0A448YKJ2_BRENA|nr:DEKNAAC102721 [Brettanomyces naardenensis]
MSQRLKHLFSPHISKEGLENSSPAVEGGLPLLQTSNLGFRSLPPSPAINIRSPESLRTVPHKKLSQLRSQEEDSDIGSALTPTPKSAVIPQKSSPGLQPISPSLSVSSGSKSVSSSPNERGLESQSELAASMAKLNIMPSVPENDLDDVLEGDDEASKGKEDDNNDDDEEDEEEEDAVSVDDHRHHHHHHHHHHHQRPKQQQQQSLQPPPPQAHSEYRSRHHTFSAHSNGNPSPRSMPSSPPLTAYERLMPSGADSDGMPSSRSTSANAGNHNIRVSARVPVSASSSTSPPISRSNSGSESRSSSANGSRQRATSVNASDQSFSNHDGFLNALRHSQSINYSTAHLLNQKMFKLRSGRIKVSADGKTHEHDYTRFRTQPVKPNRGLLGWMKRKESDEDNFTTIEHSVSLLPDSYSQQLMELKSNPDNYRWNYDDSDDGNDGDDDNDNGDDDDGDDDNDNGDDDDDGDDGDFDDEADNELIEPIIGKEQLRLINVMQEKIEHPDKFGERLRAKGSNKKPLIEKYGRIEGFIGKGSYGTICISSKTYPGDKKHKSYFAIKQLKRRPAESLHHFGNRVTSEFMISSCLTHQAIINVYDLMVDPVSMTYSQVMEYMPCGDLFSLISATNGLEVIECDCFFKQILNAITYLHSVGISHNDLKVENLLLTKKGQLKIIDFGTSAVFKTAWEDHVQYSRGPCGSERYVSPEQYRLDREYDPRLADVWCLGIIYLTMLYGNYCWDVAKECDDRYDQYLETRAKYDYSRRSESMPKQFKTIRKGAFNQIESITGGPYPNSRRYVLYNILNPDPRFRMRTYQIWQSDWIKNFQVCEAGRGYLSYDDYIELAIQTARATGSLMSPSGPPSASASGAEMVNSPSSAGTIPREESRSRSNGRKGIL